MVHHPIPLNADALLPSVPDRQTRRARAEIERRVEITEVAAREKMAMAGRLERDAKLVLANAREDSARLAQLRPGDAGLYNALDLQLAQSLADTFSKAIR